jgi:hypothetical protein
LRAFDRAGIVLTCGSFSKTLTPEYRVGWAIPGPYRDRVLHLKLATTAATAVPPQLALASYLASGGYDQHLRRLRRSLQGTVDRFSFEIAERFPEGTRISRPAGGYLLFSDNAANVIYRWEQGKPLSVFLERSGYTGRDVSTVGAQTVAGRVPILLIGSNGLALDPQRRLIVTAIETRDDPASQSGLAAEVAALVERYPVPGLARE